MKHPQKGDVWRYEYLWHREHEVGKENAFKPHPTALVTKYLDAKGRTNLFWLPITSKEPLQNRVAIEIPEIEKRRAGLATDIALWVIVDEYNHEFLETSFYFDPKGYQGAFSAAFTNEALDELIKIGKESRLKAVKRHDE